MIFENLMIADFPGVNGNKFLNECLRGQAKQNNVKHIMLKTKNDNKSVEKAGFKARIKYLVQKMYVFVQDFMSASRSEEIFLAQGSLVHLADVVEKLKEKGVGVIFYGQDINFNQLRYAYKNKLGYLLSWVQNGDPNNRYKWETVFDKIIKLWRENEWFIFDGTDLTDMICNEITKGCKNLVTSISAEEKVYLSIFKKFNVKGVLLDEDWSPLCAFIASFFKAKNVKTYCITHGYGSQKFRIDRDKKSFRLTDTFVNSEFEKNFLTDRAWDEKHIFVTGSPKYDKLLDLRKKRIQNKNEKLTLLYCGSMLGDLLPQKTAVIGVSENERGEVQRECFKNMLLLCKEIDVKLLVRPHPAPAWDNPMQEWVDFIDVHAQGLDVELRGEKNSFYDLLVESDVMVVGYWSTAIIEALIVGVPVLVYDCSGQEDAFPFAKRGICKVVRSVDEVRKVLSNYKTKHQEEGLCLDMSIYNQATWDLMGKNDGQNTDRVVHAILG